MTWDLQAAKLVTEIAMYTDIKMRRRLRQTEHPDLRSQQRSSRLLKFAIKLFGNDMALLSPSHPPMVTSSSHSLAEFYLGDPNHSCTCHSTVLEENRRDFLAR
jgi:hypothetical protein